MVVYSCFIDILPSSQACEVQIYFITPLFFTDKRSFLSCQEGAYYINNDDPFKIILRRKLALNRSSKPFLAISRPVLLQDALAFCIYLFQIAISANRSTSDEHFHKPILFIQSRQP